MGHILLWREIDGDGEYIILTDDEIDSDWIDNNTKPGYEHICDFKIDDEFPSEFPTDYVMKKSWG